MKPLASRISGWRIFWISASQLADLISGHSVQITAASAPVMAVVCVEFSRSDFFGLGVKRGVVGAHARALLKQCSAKLDGHAAAQGVGARLVGQAEHGNSAVAQRAEFALKFSQGPEFVLIVAGFDRWDE